MTSTNVAMVGMVVLSSVTKMKTAKFTDIMLSSVRFRFFFLADLHPQINRYL